MPVHSVVGGDVQSLSDLVASVEAKGESIVSVLAAANSWAVVTRPAAPAKAQQPRKPIAR